jgi:hypothetical protein
MEEDTTSLPHVGSIWTQRGISVSTIEVTATAKYICPTLGKTYIFYRPTIYSDCWKEDRQLPLKTFLEQFRLLKQ